MATYQKIKTILPDGKDGEATLISNERDTTLLGVPDIADIIADEYYTFSVWIKSLQTTEYQLFIAVGAKEPAMSEKCSSLEWERIPVTFQSDGKKIVSVAIPHGTYIVYKAMMEKGNIMSDWKKAEADTEKDITNAYSLVDQVAGQVALIVAEGSKKGSLALTPEAFKVIAEGIDLTGLVTFRSFSSSLQENWSDLEDIAYDAYDKSDDAQESAQSANEKLDEWSSENDTTQIDGGKIYTNSIKARSIDTTDLIVSGDAVVGGAIKGSRVESYDQNDPELAIFKTVLDKGVLIFYDKSASATYKEIARMYPYLGNLRMEGNWQIEDKKYGLYNFPACGKLKYTSGNYTIEKFTDGRMRMIYRKQFTVNISNPSGGIFWNELSFEDFPESFDGIPVVIFGTTGNGSGNNAWLWGKNKPSSNNVNGAYVGRGTSGTAIIDVHFIAEGEWQF